MKEHTICKYNAFPFVIIFFMIILIYCPAFAVQDYVPHNKAQWKILKDSTINREKPMVYMTYLSNSGQDSSVKIGLSVFAGDSPLLIDKFEWEKKDTIFQLKEPWVLNALNVNEDGDNIRWLVDLVFPYTYNFGEDDYIVLHTNKGILKTPTTKEGLLREQILQLQQTQEKLQKETHGIISDAKTYKVLWIIFASVLTVIIIFLIFLYIYYNRRQRSNKILIDNLNDEISETSRKMAEVRDAVGLLQQNGLSTINLLCDEYYEKSDSDNVKISIYNDMEKHILTYREAKKVAALENELNLYYDNLFFKLKEQIPSLQKKDLTFLTYLFSGFSPRAVSVFMEINLKHFYYRRSKLKEIIDSSDAPDKELFLSKF